MKRVWMISEQVKSPPYFSLRWALGQFDEASAKIEGARYGYCPKLFTTRLHPLSGECYVVEGSRYKAHPVKPRIEFHASPVCLIDFRSKVFLDLDHHGFWHEWDHFTTYDNDVGHTTFAEYDIGIRGASFSDLRDTLLRLNKKATINTPFFVNKIEPLEVKG